MKNPLQYLSIAVLLYLPLSAAQAQILPALADFNSSTGNLRIPNLVFDGKLYYLDMTIVDAGSLTLAINESSVVDVTPDASLSGNIPANIVGTWNVEGEETQFTFNSDASWSMTQASGVDDECADGGEESGTFRYTASTGVFFPTFLTDENGECGLSHSGNLLRFIPDGNTLTVHFDADSTATLVRVE